MFWDYSETIGTVAQLDGGEVPAKAKKRTASAPKKPVNTVKATKAPSSREEWLLERRAGIGGSDAAAAMGLHKYTTLYSLWADKTGRLPEKADNEAMRQGRDEEEIIARRFVEEVEKDGLKLKLRKDSRTFRNSAYPYSLAHIDRRVVGMKAGLECKSCSAYRASEFTDATYPHEYHIQCLHYLAVTGWDTWYLAVKIDKTAFKVYEIRREDYKDDIEKVQAAIKEFWESFVLTDSPPPADGLDPTTDAINTVYKVSRSGSIEIEHMEETFIEVARLKVEIKRLERELELFYQQIKLEMGENERAVCGPWVVNWKPNKNGTRMFSVKEAA